MVELSRGACRRCSCKTIVGIGPDEERFMRRLRVRRVDHDAERVLQHEHAEVDFLA